MTFNSRVRAARKAARTAQVRRNFVRQFSRETLTALVDIVNNKVVTSPSRRRSLAAYKANLTRGAYSDFVSVRNDGTLGRDSLGLTRMV